VSVKLNGKVGPYFQSCKRVRRGDSLSPLLFNLAADCLTHMVVQAQKNSLVVGIVFKAIRRGVTRKMRQGEATPYHWKNAWKRREIGKRKGKKNKAEKLRRPGCPSFLLALSPRRRFKNLGGGAGREFDSKRHSYSIICR
jgi:hypothetical protein